ncbi:FAD:protein FMN transferase [Paenibacillus beijingensis]|uniref:FAD:protein FMN transferase n=1 Tax=Paenibacillus beijingensis TaxID=1126833 RepID=A0A0D5NGP2_9BACL|nr:FAD:protein FMN transferase [Paenibacillus beijingensis]AJY74290.1 hypothetical protein VN24_06470 [Paenibacillus beijingensis]
MENVVASVREESLHSFRFKAMNTTVECSLLCTPEQICELEELTFDWFAQAEKRFSRFRPDSELSYLNKRAGERCMISAAMMEVLQLAESYKRLTEGVFDPYVLDALLQSGYDESFDLVKNRPLGELGSRTMPTSDHHTLTSNQHTLTSDRHSPIRPREMQIDPVMKSLKLPPLVTIDLGGIVKSWSAQRLAGYFRDKKGIRRGLINAGGDLSVWESPKYEARAWRIAVENPWTDQTKAGIFVMQEGAAATSGTLGRSWMSGGKLMHHLIDPSTMQPSDSDVVQCTVTGRNATECEIWAKTICIAGSKRGLSLLTAKADPDCEALLFTKDRRTLFFGDPSSLGAAWRDVTVDRVYPKNHFNPHYPEVNPNDFVFR